MLDDRDVRLRCIDGALRIHPVQTLMGGQQFGINAGRTEVPPTAEAVLATAAKFYAFATAAAEPRPAKRAPSRRR